ncbi:MarR family winged helix-turn-helix transcriptional regulator [Pseudonocardia bannensis]|uniref:MarR family transcriptional regulator n=1 Tax=Pseudonocardia bannensis TaxID=630973 RepID=A0A848DAW1_9PSEU|nr:MarR family transcriptional regulator [Pseudonocardia bannensis]NMH90114.1 MarR family transcriptional regulator [Pseudonocardia bannensis]
MSVADATPRWLGESEMRFWRSFIHAATLLEARLNRELVEAHGISHADYAILAVLSEQPGEQMRMSALAELTASSKSRLSHQIARMERAGLVQRKECASDARGILAGLLPRGRQLLEQAAPTHVDGVRRYVIDRVEPAEQEILAQVMERVLAELRRSEPEARAS